MAISKIFPVIASNWPYRVALIESRESRFTMRENAVKHDH